MSKLISNYGQDIEDPTPSQIVEALLDIAGHDGRTLTLQEDRGVIQTTPGPDGGLLIEYMLKEERILYRTLSSTLSPEEVAEAFERFRHEDDSWIADYEWESNDVVARLSKGCAGVFLALAAGLVVLMSI